LKLLDTYFSFVYHAQRADGTFHNFMSFDRRWLDDEQRDDALGRAVMALGTLAATQIADWYNPLIEECFYLALPQVKLQSLQGLAYSLIGLSRYLEYKKESQVFDLVRESANGLIESYRKHTDKNWRWFEPVITYDNGMLCYALFTAHQILGEDKYLETAKESCDFLLSHTYTGKHFSFVGQDGWFRRGGDKAKFDQQPIEAASTVSMLKGAYHATKDHHYLVLMRKAFDWFLGANDAGDSLYNFRSGGCADGLTRNGINHNQGAESTLSFLSALLCLLESRVRDIHDRDSTELMQSKEGAAVA